MSTGISHSKPGTKVIDLRSGKPFENEPIFDALNTNQAETDCLDHTVDWNSVRASDQL
jgi:hypothetical protein